MERNFRYLREMHGDAGAREIFEKICTQLLHAQYGENAHSIRTCQGDAGIDILVGDFSVPIVNYQCKFFLDGVGNSQKNQIRNSFNRAITTTTYKMKKWVLCLPCVLTVQEFSWWSEWSSKQIKQTGVDIVLHDGEYLLSELKRYNLYSVIFHDDVRLKLDAILGILQEKTVEELRQTKGLRINEPKQEDLLMLCSDLDCDDATQEITSPDEFMSTLEYLFMSMEYPEQVIKLSSLLGDMGVQGGINMVEDGEIVFFNSMDIDEKKRMIHFLRSGKKVFTLFVDSVTDLITKITCGIHELTIWYRNGEEVRIAFNF